MKGALYTRPILCKSCDNLFDFPTFTSDLAEKDVPIRTRICCDCLIKMRHDEDVREYRQSRGLKTVDNSFRKDSDHPMKIEPANDSDDQTNTRILVPVVKSEDANSPPRTDSRKHSATDTFSSRTSTETTETRDESQQNDLNPDMQTATSPSILLMAKKQTFSDLRSILN